MKMKSLAVRLRAVVAEDDRQARRGRRLHPDLAGQHEDPDVPANDESCRDAKRDGHRRPVPPGHRC